MADNFIELKTGSLITPQGMAELNRMLNTLFKLVAGDGSTQRVYSGFGVPTITAGNGSLYLRKDGSTSTTLYVRIGGVWVAK